MTDEVENDILEMEKAGVIRPSDPPWALPVVLVKKKDRSLRFSVDFRKRNESTLKDAYPLPHVDENLDALAGNLYLTSLDLTSRYWQLIIPKLKLPL